MRIKTIIFSLLASTATTALAHQQVYAHTHDDELLARLTNLLFSAPLWVYVIGAIAVVAILRVLWKTS